jgi:hypothetical protein
MSSEHYNRYNKFDINEYNNQNFGNSQYTDVYKGDFNSQLSVSQEPSITYETREHYLVISSKDRELSQYPSSSEFVIYIDQDVYKNIKSIELIQTIIPDKNSVQLEPYLLLNIAEFKHVMDSPNKNISEAFAILQMTSPPVAGSFIQIDKRLHENTPLTFITPKANLSKMTIKLTDCDGNLFDFGGSGTTTKAYQTTFAFRITTLHSNTKPLNKRNVY